MGLKCSMGYGHGNIHRTKYFIEHEAFSWQPDMLSLEHIPIFSIERRLDTVM